MEYNTWPPKISVYGGFARELVRILRILGHSDP
jgi:hypothetical protein